jgi:hypothetical protein
MSIFSRFFGSKDEDEDAGAPLVANPEAESPLSLQVLFAGGLKLSADAVTQALRSYHPSLAKARCEIEPGLNKDGKVFGLAGWGKHVVKLVGFDLPMPAEAVEACVGPSHYPQELKQQARAHRGHLLLFYAGHEAEPLEQYVALAAVAGALTRLGALVVLNEAAHTSFPAKALSGSGVQGDILEMLRSLPLPVLYCGFVKYNVEGVDGVWMRTYGAHLLGLPDFAALAAGHHEGEKYFELFNNLLNYLRNSGATMAAGHTMQVGPDTYLRARAPAKGEYFLKSEGELLVVEEIGAGEINR